MDIRRLLPALVALTALAVTATAVVLVLRASGPGGEVAVGASSEPRRDAGLGAPGDRQRLASPAGRARAVLARWDQRRAAAWSAGDPAALLDLYTTSSAAGRADRAMLRAYVRRGLRVVGLRTQVLALRVLADEPGRIRIRISDRIVGARAAPVGGGSLGLALPSDRPTTRVLTLVRGADAPSWRMARVTAQPRASPAASTALTSWSRKP